MDGQSCETCRFYEPCDESNNDFADDMDFDGYCRRHPPVPSAESGGATLISVVPPVDLGDWCGEYVPANPETFSDGAVTLARFVLLGDRTAARALVDKLKEDA